MRTTLLLFALFVFLPVSQVYAADLSAEFKKIQDAIKTYELALSKFDPATADPSSFTKETQKKQYKPTRVTMNKAATAARRAGQKLKQKKSDLAKKKVKFLGKSYEAWSVHADMKKRVKQFEKDYKSYKKAGEKAMEAGATASKNKKDFTFPDGRYVPPGTKVDAYLDDYKFWVKAKMATKSSGKDLWIVDIEDWFVKGQPRNKAVNFKKIVKYGSKTGNKKNPEDPGSLIAAEEANKATCKRQKSPGECKKVVAGCKWTGTSCVYKK